MASDYGSGYTSTPPTVSDDDNGSFTSSAYSAPSLPAAPEVPAAPLPAAFPCDPTVVCGKLGFVLGRMDGGDLEDLLATMVENYPNPTVLAYLDAVRLSHAAATAPTGE